MFQGTSEPSPHPLSFPLDPEGLECMCESGWESMQGRDMERLQGLGPSQACDKIFFTYCGAELGEQVIPHLLALGSRVQFGSLKMLECCQRISGSHSQAFQDPGF